MAIVYKDGKQHSVWFKTSDAFKCMEILKKRGHKARYVRIQHS